MTLKEILDKTEIFTVHQEEKRGRVRKALGQPKDRGKWLSFVLTCLVASPANSIDKAPWNFKKIFAARDGKLMSAWEVEVTDTAMITFKGLVDKMVDKPEWMKNFKVESTKDGFTVTLVGEPLIPPDYREVLGRR